MRSAVPKARPATEPLAALAPNACSAAQQSHSPISGPKEKVHRIGNQLMAIAAEGPRTRYYLPSNEEHEQAADASRPPDVPDAELPEQALGFRVQGYGMRTWAELFTNRQLTAMVTFSDLVSVARARIYADSNDNDYANAVAVYLALAVSRVTGNSTTLCTWNPAPSKEGVNNAFRLQTVSMTWDWAELSVFTDGPADPATSAEWVSRAVALVPASIPAAVEQQDAARCTSRGLAVSTDPPYYDNVGYADLSDFFYVWIRRSVSAIFPDLMGTVLTPKTDELVADPFRHKHASRFFEDGFRSVFKRIREDNIAPYPMGVFYAFKQAESDGHGDSSTGWETLLDGMIGTGWMVTGTWPMRTERTGRPS